MRNYPFALAAVLALLVAFPSHAAEKPRAARGNQSQPKKVWTNDDMDQLRARGLISIAGQEPAEPATQAPAAPSESSFPIYASRLDDPNWYAEKTADLQAEMDKRAAALRAEQDALALVADRITQPGVAMDKKSAGVTPAAGLAILEAQVQETQSQIDELGDLARQHNIPPGILRG